jgi:hypothetical protein
MQKVAEERGTRLSPAIVPTAAAPASPSLSLQG